MRAAMLDAVQRGWQAYADKGEFRSAQITVRIDPDRSATPSRRSRGRSTSTRTPTREPLLITVFAHPHAGGDGLATARQQRRAEVGGQAAPRRERLKHEHGVRDGHVLEVPSRPTNERAPPRPPRCSPRRPRPRGTRARRRPRSGSRRRCGGRRPGRARPPTRRARLRERRGVAPDRRLRGVRALGSASSGRRPRRRPSPGEDMRLEAPIGRPQLPGGASAIALAVARGGAQSSHSRDSSPRPAISVRQPRRPRRVPHPRQLPLARVRVVREPRLAVPVRSPPRPEPARPSPPRRGVSPTGVQPVLSGADSALGMRRAAATLAAVAAAARAPRPRTRTSPSASPTTAASTRRTAAPRSSGHCAELGLAREPDHRPVGPVAADDDRRQALPRPLAAAGGGLRDPRRLRRLPVAADRAHRDARRRRRSSPPSRRSSRARTRRSSTS